MGFTRSLCPCTCCQPYLGKIITDIAAHSPSFDERIDDTGTDTYYAPEPKRVGA